MKKITLLHGEGGRLTQKLIQEKIKKIYGNAYLDENFDSARLKTTNNIAFTTDSFVVKPLFFNGGDIGKLAVSGTVNDLITVGAIPQFLSCSFIIEEGFLMRDFEKILFSIKETSEKANVEIVTGDTKVVPHGDVDEIYINTAGIGFLTHPLRGKVEAGDGIIISGTIAMHGTTLLAQRFELDCFDMVKSDCMPLTDLLPIIKKYAKFIHLMRDPTRGGVATIINEIAMDNLFDIEIDENSLNIVPEVKAINKILGIDPLYVACEGRMIFLVNKAIIKDFLIDLQSLPNGKNASLIGMVKKTNQFPQVYLKTLIGGQRILSPLDDIILPRIC